MSGPAARFQRDGGGTTSGGFGLPGDLLRESRRRVRIIALLVLVGSGADFILMIAAIAAWLVDRSGAYEWPQTIPLVSNALTVASAVAVLVVDTPGGVPVRCAVDERACARLVEPAPACRTR